MANGTNSLMLCAIVAGTFSLSTFNIGLSIAAQSNGCLPLRVTIVDYKDTTPSRGDMYEYHIQGAEPYFADGTRFTKIMAAVPGDRVEVDLNGITVFGVDGEMKRYNVDARPMLNYSKISADWFERTVEVPEGHFFAMGTLAGSFDSRFWGVVPLNRIEGKAYGVL
ncbi:signal peptidase I [Enterovibrio norvegicus]|uniref:signal peptidase I n=1 Tax=Enterovibrio norvegicus TaxID=188144 RepID=UPI00352D8C73